MCWQNPRRIVAETNNIVDGEVARSHIHMEFQLGSSSGRVFQVVAQLLQCQQVVVVDLFLTIFPPQAVVLWPTHSLSLLTTKAKDAHLLTGVGIVELPLNRFEPMQFISKYTQVAILNVVLFQAEDDLLVLSFHE